MWQIGNIVEKMQIVLSRKSLTKSFYSIGQVAYPKNKTAFKIINEDGLLEIKRGKIPTLCILK